MSTQLPDLLSSLSGFPLTLEPTAVDELTEWENPSIFLTSFLPLTSTVPDVDLVVTEVTAPATAYIGEQISISWKVENQGSIDAYNEHSFWNDSIYLSMDLVFDRTDIYLYSHIHHDLAAGESYTGTSDDWGLDWTLVKVPGDYYLLMVTDVRNFQPETNEVNNTYAVPITLTMPDVDLVVTEITAPATAYIGEPISISWTVQNQGSVAALVEFWFWNDNIYLSRDLVFDHTDIFLSESYWNHLPAGESYTGITDDWGLYWSSVTESGDYYLLVVTDRGGSQLETNETNNTYAVPITLTAPDVDLVVTEVTAPATAPLGKLIPVSWTVANQGSSDILIDQEYMWTDQVYLSTDSTYDSGDIFIHQDHYGRVDPSFLEAGQSYTATTEIVIPDTEPGTYYLLFLADSNFGYPDSQLETNELNNSLAIPIVLITPDIDLLIAEATAPDSVRKGETIAVSWTVKNTGASVASGSWSKWYDDYYHPPLDSYWKGWSDVVYLSEDSTLGSGDIAIYGQINPGSLCADESYTLSADLSIPERTDLGDYYLIFKTDNDNNQSELDNLNNTLALPISLNPSVDGPDLVVTEASAPSFVRLGESISVSWTVSNQGNEVARGRWNDRDWYWVPWSDDIFLSDDETLDSGDLRLTHYTTSEIPLGPDENYSRTTSVTIPNTTTGERYLLVRAGGFSFSETDETNNIFAIPITVAPSGADLVITEATAPSLTAPGDYIGISWTVLNQGDSSTTLTWRDAVYLSDDLVYDSGDSLLYSHFVYPSFLNDLFLGNHLDGGESYTVTAFLTLPNEDLDNRYLIIVTNSNDNQPEADKTNNTWSIPIILSDVDLAVTEVTAPATARLGESITVSWTVENQGSPTGNDEEDGLYWYDEIFLSSDPIFDAEDQYIYSHYNELYGDSLGTGESYTVTTNMFLPQSELGNRYLVIVTNSDGELETDKTNNVLTIPITLSSSDVDLVVTSATAPSVAKLGESIRVSWSVQNQGNQPANGWQYDSWNDGLWLEWVDSVYLSNDAVYDSSDTLISSQSSQIPLEAGDSYTLTTDILLPNSLTGERYLLFWANHSEEQPETDSTNNILALPILLTSSDVDLVITEATAPTSANLGESITVSWTVKNQGNGVANQDWWDRVYLRQQSAGVSTQTINLVTQRIDSQTPLGSNSSYTITQNITIPTDAPPAWFGTGYYAWFGTGYYDLVFATDTQNEQSEALNTNNTLTIPIALTTTDLTITQVTAPTTATLGEFATVSWTVINQRNGAADANWLDIIYLSRDGVYDDNDIALGSESRDSATPLAPGASYTVSKQVSLSSAEVGEYYLIVKTDAYNSQLEIDESNNTFAVPVTLSVPDLTVTGATAPTTANLGEAITVSWTVANRGQGAAKQDWLDGVYLSRDGIYDREDTPILQEQVVNALPLAPGGNYAFTRELTLPSADIQEGYLLFVTDIYGVQREADESNNTFALPISLAGADLVLETATAPSTAQAGALISVSWSVANQGGAAAQSGWRDTLYLSSDPVYDANDSYLGSQSLSAPLGSGESYTLTQEILLPTLTPGQQYLLFVSNSDASQAETDPTNNARAVAIQLTAPAEETNHSPHLNQALANQTAQVNQAFYFAVPDDAFIDLDNDALTYSLSPETPLPAGLVFENGVFSGTPTPESSHTYSLMILAADPDGAMASAVLSLQILLPHSLSSANPDVVGTPGNDLLDAGAQPGRYRLDGADGDDLIVGSAQRDILLGGPGNDALFGNDGMDKLYGDSGDDLLDGGAGMDILSGGAGADRFVLRSGHGADQILDFNPAEGDKIALADLSLGSLTFNGNQILQGAETLAWVTNHEGSAVLNLDQDPQWFVSLV